MKSKSYQAILDIIDAFEKKEIYLEDLDPEIIARFRNILNRPNQDNPLIIVCIKDGQVQFVQYGNDKAKKLNLKFILCEQKKDSTPSGMDVKILHVRQPNEWSRRVLDVAYRLFQKPGKV